MIWLIIILSLAVIVALSILLLSYLAYRKAFFSSEKRRENIYDLPHDAQYSAEKDKMIALIDEMNGLPFEQVYISAYDNTKLAARYYHVADGAPLQIQFHGYRGMAIRDFCGGNKLARENGFNTLVVDQRAHGKSEGHIITFGIKERYDCLSWAQYAVKRFPGSQIYLAGVSMGAATVLMASELDLPHEIKGIIADCPYSAPAAIIKKVCVDSKIPKAAYIFVKIGAKLFGKFDPEESSAVEAVKKSKVPILLIHGEADKFVPCKMSKEIAAAAPNAELYTFPRAGHGISYILDPERYKKVTLKFIDKCRKSEFNP